MINIFDHINSSKTFSRNRSSRNLFFEKCYNRATAFEEFVYSERQKYGINSLKIKQNFFQKNLWAGQF
jgi:hypothetical protein